MIHFVIKNLNPPLSVILVICDLSRVVHNGRENQDVVVARASWLLVAVNAFNSRIYFDIA